jgi:GT2 family glycosyltransferase
VGGKFFKLGQTKFHVKGIAYGPFAPNAAGEPFASPEQTASDFAQIRSLGSNVIRIYHVPGKWFLDLAAEHKLKVFIDVPWNKHLCFLDSPQARNEARSAVRRAVSACARHPAVFAFSVANEIPPDIVRWSGAKRVAEFIDELIQEAKQIDPECLCTFTNYPPTEFLRPQCIDFVCFNVYLHQEPAFKAYLARLQMLAESKPLLLGELGLDSLREGEARKCEMLRWQLENAFRAGLAGVIVFSFTDDWWRGGQQVEDWQMGLTTRDRQPKESFTTVAKEFGSAPHFPLSRYPKVSIVIATYNGERTLKACLDSLQALNYPDYEVILVDDGSTDTTPQIAFLYPKDRYFRHEKNLGLSVARNTGIAAALGEVVAFADSDCRADEDWLYYLIGDLISSEFAGMGGPNLLPPDDSAVAAAIMVSPGGPAHVMLSDRQAEHIPGCNMAFFKRALTEIGGFDPIFHHAGDDVDVCWRIQQIGYKIGFSPSALVWHYRRSTVGDYLTQQHGYGEAEALLVRKHPEYFNAFGASIWRGRIYNALQFGALLRQPIIYRGLFGSAGFQSLYTPTPPATMMLFTSPEYHLLITLPLWILSVYSRYLLPLAIASLGISLSVCAVAGIQASLPRGKTRPWSRPLVGLLFFLQPIVRGWARYQGRLLLGPTPLAAQQTLDSVALREGKRSLREVDYWTDEPVDRLAFVGDILRRLDHQGWPNKPDIGWSDYEVEIYGSRWSTLQLVTVAEEHARGRRLIRCQLRPRWSFQARGIFWACAGFELLLLGFLGPLWHWLWFVLLTLPLFAWFLRHDQRTLQSMILVFLDELAKDWKMTRLHSSAAPHPPAATSAQTVPSPTELATAAPKPEPNSK